MRNLLFTTLLLLAIHAAATAQAVGDTAEVLLETTAGDIRIKLYNETPQHRDNFLKLVKKHLYDSVLFHRTIPKFMIQTGDPFSKKAQPGDAVGGGTLDYTIPAEIRMPALYHKRGAVAAAREGDDVNPEHRSDACQFYIVWGNTHSSAALEAQQERLDTLFGDSVKFSPEAINAYRKVGGTPHLDGTYTVFGEVVEGLGVVEKIQAVETDDYDRPLYDVRILRATVVRDLPQQKNATPPRKTTKAKR